MTQNGSIREKKWSKSKFEKFAPPTGPWVPDLVIFCRFWKMKILSIFTTLAGHGLLNDTAGLVAADCRPLSTHFSKNFFLLKMTQNGAIREKKWSKTKFENFALPLVPWVPDLVIFRRFWKMKT